ncbi:MAG: hypothetical protein GX945_00620 [Lentisphaerae bacterium]|nr:hypothetical protein [Lentisphaerota bacterium]
MIRLTRIVCALAVTLLAGRCQCLAQAEPQAKEQQQTMEILSAEDFLREVRRPLRTDAWGEITGSITHKTGDSTSVKGVIRVRITFTPESMHAQVVLNDVNVYGFEQKHGPDDKTSAVLDLPEEERAPGLFSFGVIPADLSFAFIYWDFVEELPRQSSRRRECRVMKLADPKSEDTVQVWFSAQHGFPMEAWWYHHGDDKPWRKLELKGAKKHANGLWFVKEMRLEGQGWKTLVRFDHAEINPIGANGK